MAQILKPDHSAIDRVNKRQMIFTKSKRAVLKYARVTLGLLKYILRPNGNLFTLNSRQRPVFAKERIVARTGFRRIFFYRSMDVIFSFFEFNDGFPAGMNEQFIDIFLPRFVFIPLFFTHN